MTKQFDLHFHVRVLQSGQSSPFADTRHLYEIESSLPPVLVKRFCTYLLHPCDTEHSPVPSPRTRYRFERIGDRRYRYGVTAPYLD